jgi:hypothetical protein
MRPPGCQKVCCGYSSTTSRSSPTRSTAPNMRMYPRSPTMRRCSATASTAARVVNTWPTSSRKSRYADYHRPHRQLGRGPRRQGVEVLPRSLRTALECQYPSLLGRPRIRLSVPRRRTHEAAHTAHWPTGADCAARGRHGAGDEAGREMRLGVR